MTANKGFCSVEIRKINNDYFIDSESNVYSRPRNKVRGGIVLQKLNTCGYPSVRLRENNKPVDKAVHRLLAQAFIPNPENKPHVNHKDGNKQNNSLKNLEWATVGENVQHAWDTGLQKRVANSGIKYIYFDPVNNSYRAMVDFGGRRRIARRTTSLQTAIQYREELLKQRAEFLASADTK